MPSDQSAVSVLIQEVLSAPDLAHDDVLRRLLQAGLQDLIDAEIGAGPYERSSKRSNRRNGKRPKKLATTAGEVDLAIPKLRQGSFFPSLLSPRKRVDNALMRRDLLSLNRRGLDPQGRRPGAGAGQRVRYLQIHRLKDLQGHRRGSG